MQRPQPGHLPAEMFTWPTPPTAHTHLSTVPEERAPTEGPIPSWKPTTSTLRPGGQPPHVEQMSMNSWAYSETGWAAALSQAVQRDADFVDEWQRSMDVLLIFVRRP